MNISNFLRKTLTGLSMNQEYLCLRKETLDQVLGVFISDPGSDVEITANHFFLGYKPVVIGVFCKRDDRNIIDLISDDEVTLKFKSLIGVKNVATLWLKREKIIFIDEYQITLFVGVHGKHVLINPFYQWINQGLEKLRSRRTGNVDLPGNLYDQVRIAYSIPRTIAVVTLGDKEKINLFPTDLHGSVVDHFYVESLRLGGLANDQVEKQNRIVISEVDSMSFEKVYSLGKNHMRQMGHYNDFELHKNVSQILLLPLPASVTRYYELERIDFYDVGIHRIHLFRILNKEIVDPKNDTLAHVHQFYAQWRKDQNLKTDYLLR
jgi:flavin reductase (DIM6/NTAB) family NADH-FMN oxidoreductase RutF